MVKASEAFAAIGNTREIAQQFTPNWFTASMGTGAVALVLANLHPVFFEFARAMWIANMVLFVVFTVLFVERAVWFPESAKALLRDPIQSMFLGAIPMALATIVNGFDTFGPALFGNTAFTIAHGMWWADTALAVACGWIVPYVMFTVQEEALERMNAIWLLPFVPSEVAAASAAQIAPHVSAGSAQFLVVAGGILWAFSVPLAVTILGILFLRLALYKIPPREVGVSNWLTIGPLGTGALALVLLGEAARSAFAGTPLEPVAAVAYGFGIIVGLLLWAYGLWWWVLAIALTHYHARTNLPFNLGWWAFTFPFGVFTLSTFALAQATGAEFFKVAGVTFAVVLIALYAVVATRTVMMISRV